MSRVFAELIAWLSALLASIPGNIGVRLRGWFYRKMAADGKPVIENGCVFRNPRNIRFGHNVTIGMRCFFEATNGSVQCEDFVAFNADVHFNASKGGRISVGRDSLIGPGVKVFTSNHLFVAENLPAREQGDSIADVSIGRNCWLGANVIVTSGVRIGDGSVIGAGAVVTSDIPENSLAVGVPARARKKMGSGQR